MKNVRSTKILQQELSMTYDLQTLLNELAPFLNNGAHNHIPLSILQLTALYPLKREDFFMDLTTYNSTSA